MYFKAGDFNCDANSIIMNIAMIWCFLLFAAAMPAPHDKKKKIMKKLKKLMKKEMKLLKKLL